MPVNSRHAQYDAALPAWQRARDVLAGEDAVKAAGQKYLPRMDSQNEKEYAVYTVRASFFGATSRTLEEYLDLVFRRAPTISTLNSQNASPARTSALNLFLRDCDLWGMDLVRYARQVVREVLSVGRCGTLVLCDPPPHPPAKQPSASQLSTLNPQLSGPRNDIPKPPLVPPSQRVLIGEAIN